MNSPLQGVQADPFHPASLEQWLLPTSLEWMGADMATARGGVADRPTGFHYEPTVITGCSADMEIMRKEIFGPVLPIQAVSGLDEAIALANDSEYGLTSSIFTKDLNAAMHACRELRFGETYVNREHFEAMQGFHAGRRKSGIGGADGKHGLYEYTETHGMYMQNRALRFLLVVLRVVVTAGESSLSPVVPPFLRRLSCPA